MQKPKQTRDSINLDFFVSEVIKTPGLGECLRLCDVSELEHVCELVEEAGHSDTFGLRDSLQKNLWEPVFRFAQEMDQWQDEQTRKHTSKLSKIAGKTVHVGRAMRMEMGPTLGFLECIEEVLERMHLGLWSEMDAQASADRLRSFWYRWIAYVSSFYMWSKVPRILAAQKLSRHNGKLPAKDGKPGRVRRLDHEGICKAWDELQPTRGSHTAGIVAKRCGCTPKRVREIVNERDEAKKREPKPVG